MEFSEFFSELQKRQRITEISLFINGLCNLACPFCYAKHIQPGIGISVSNKIWLKFLSEAIKDTTILVSIVGKEPFMTPDETTDLLERLDSEFPFIKKGVVSNLHLMTAEIAKRLVNINNLYIDVSLDGVIAVHNKLRGHKAVEKTMTGVRYLQEAGVDNIFVSHMLLEENMGTFSEFVRFCGKYGLRKFSIFPYCSIEADDPLLFPARNYCGFIQKVLQPGYLDDQGIEMIIKNDYLNLPINKAAIDCFIDVERLQEDATGVLYNVHKVAGNLFFFNFLPFPVEFVSALRINYNGDVVFCRDMMRTDVSERAAGHISEGYKAIKGKIYSSALVEEFYRGYFTYLLQLQSWV